MPQLQQNRAHQENVQKEGPQGGPSDLHCKGSESKPQKNQTITDQ